jgi:hypothetical protein
MHIMAYLYCDKYVILYLISFILHRIILIRSKKPSEPAQIEVVEKRLCSIRYYTNGLVTMTVIYKTCMWSYVKTTAFIYLLQPGLSKMSEFYEFQIHNEVFRYSIYNISKELEAIDEEKEWKIYQEYYTK